MSKPLISQMEPQPLKSFLTNMKKLSLSVVLATRNEESNIGQCLDSVKDLADEIIVADEESNDKTTDVVKKYSVKIISVPHQQNFHITKNIAIDAAKGDWILQLDADEVVSPELAKEIKEILTKRSMLNANPYNGYWINRKNWFVSKFLTKGGQYPDSTLRLYRRGMGHLPAKDVHEQAVVDGPVGHLKNDLLHYRDTSFEKYLDGFNRYSSFIASQQKFKFGIFQTLYYLCIKPIFIFIKIFIRHRGYVDGFPGFVFALYSGLIYPVAYIKFWQCKYYPA